MACADHTQVELERDDHDGDGSDREVHVEDPAPREVVDEETAEQRTGDRCDAEHRSDQPHVATALPRRDDVGDDRLRADDEPAGADALDRTEADELRHRLTEPREHRAGEEDEDRGLEDGLAPVHVAELPVDRRRHGRREQVRGHDPGEVVEPSEVADDRRQRRRDDGLVERGQEHAEHQRGEDRANSGHARGGLLDADGGHPDLLVCTRSSWARVSGWVVSGVAASARSPSSTKPR